MLKYIFRSATGSFSRTIGRIIAYIIIGLLLIFLGGFLNIGNVSALTYNSASFTFCTAQGKWNTSTLWNTPANYNCSLQHQIVFGSSNTIPVGSYVKSNIRLATNFSKDLDGFKASNDRCVVEVNYVSDTTLNGSGARIYDFNFIGVVDQNKDVYCNFPNQLTFPNWTGNNKILSLDNMTFYDSSQKISQDIQDAKDSINSNIDSMKEKQEETNNTIKDSNVSDASSSANSFFEDFEDKDYGLSGVITMPLTFINKITSGTCTPLSFSAPFVNQDITLPCMYDIYTTYFGDFLSIYQTITFGIVSYWVCINIFQMVKNFKDPDKDEIEVLDL